MRKRTLGRSILHVSSYSSSNDTRSHHSDLVLGWDNGCIQVRIIVEINVKVGVEDRIGGYGLNGSGWVSIRFGVLVSESGFCNSGVQCNRT